MKEGEKKIGDIVSVMYPTCYPLVIRVSSAFFFFFIFCILFYWLVGVRWIDDKLVQLLFWNSGF